MNIQQALDVLSEVEAKSILTGMFTTLLTQNAGASRINKVYSHDVSEKVEHLSDISYDILARINQEFEHAWGSVWETEIYDTEVDGITVRQKINDIRQDRAEQITHYINNSLIKPLPANARILDYGLGSGVTALQFLKQNPETELWGFDEHHYPVKALEQHPQYHKITDPNNIPENHFDLVMLNWVLHHAKPEQHGAIVQNLYRAVKKDGSNTGQVFIIETELAQDKFANPDNLMLENLTEDQQLQKLTAAAFVKDFVSSNGMTPNKPFTQTHISGHQNLVPWLHNLLQENFSIGSKDDRLAVQHLAKLFDQFDELSGSVVLVPSKNLNSGYNDQTYMLDALQTAQLQVD